MSNREPTTNCKNPNCYRPGNPFCWVCWNDLTKEQQEELESSRDDEVEFLGLAIFFGWMLVENGKIGIIASN